MQNGVAVRITCIFPLMRVLGNYPPDPASAHFWGHSSEHGFDPYGQELDCSGHCSGSCTFSDESS